MSVTVEHDLAFKAALVAAEKLHKIVWTVGGVTKKTVEYLAHRFSPGVHS